MKFLVFFLNYVYSKGWDFFYSFLSCKFPVLNLVVKITYVISKAVINFLRENDSS
jgi:hypothetical protein